MAENVFKAAPKGTHQYDKFVKPEEVASWAQEGLFVLWKFIKNIFFRDFNLCCYIYL